MPVNMATINTNEAYDTNYVTIGENKLGKTVLKANSYIEKETKLATLNGDLVDHNDENPGVIEIFDFDNNIKGWFELSSYPKWLNLIRYEENVDKCNVMAVYSNNQVLLKANKDIKPENELSFCFKAKLEDENCKF